MVKISIARFTVELPVPATALSHIVANDMSNMAIDTTRTTGIAVRTNNSSCP